jgi:hypothetical protein
MHNHKERNLPDRDSGISITRMPTNMLDSVQQEYRKIVQSEQKIRYNYLSGVHNPWGKAAHLFDSWKLLEVCHSRCLLDLVSAMIGADIILWDSRFFNLRDFTSAGAWIRESDFSPFEQLQGVTVRIPVSTSELIFRTQTGDPGTAESATKCSETCEPLALEPGCVAGHDVHLPYRYGNSGTASCRGEYIIQYASSHSHFVRDQSSTVQRSLAERLPLINFAEAPIWLLQGIDHMHNDFVTGFAPTVAQWTSAKW